MKNRIRQFVALVAILVASSFVGMAEDLPFGADAIRNYAVTNTAIVVVQAIQVNPEDTSQEIVFMGSQLGIKFRTYSELLTYIRGKLRTAEGRFLEPKLLTNEVMIINIDVLTVGYGGNVLDFYNDLRHISLVRGDDGQYRFPSGFIDTFEPKIARYVPIITPKVATRAKIVVFDSEDNVETADDTEFPPVGRLPDASIDGSGNLYVLDKYVINDPTKQVYLTVEFEDGTVKRWGGDGREIALTSPRLSMELLNGDIQLVLKDGNVSDNLKIQGSADGKIWKTVLTTRVTDKEMHFGISPGTNVQAFYHIGGE